jgi:O-antigen/teichoic acid export membrane protein
MRDDAVVALLFGGGVVLTTATLVLDFVFVAERESGKMLVRNLVTSGVKLPLLALGTVVAARSSTVILAAWVVSLFVGLVVAVAVMLPRLDRGYRPSLGGLRGEARAIRPALVGQHLISIGGTVPMYVLPLLVTARLSAGDNAHFYTTWMVGSLFFMVSSWIATALFAEGSHRPSDLPAKLRHSILLTAGIALPAMAITILGGHVILGVFGPGYATGYVLLVVLTASAIPDAVTNLYVAVLRVHGRIRTAAGLNIAMAGLAVVLSWVLLPVLGITGAGVAWLGAQTAGALWVVVDVRRHPLDPATGA